VLEAKSFLMGISQIWYYFIGYTSLRNLQIHAIENKPNNFHKFFLFSQQFALVIISCNIGQCLKMTTTVTHFEYFNQATAF
jgi:hypothetical protein